MFDYSKDKEYIDYYDKHVFGEITCDCGERLLECPKCLSERKSAALGEASKNYFDAVGRQQETFRILWANNIVFLGALGYLFNEARTVKSLEGISAISVVLLLLVALGGVFHTFIIESVFKSELNQAKNWLSHIYHLENSVWGRLNKTRTFTDYSSREVITADNRNRRGSVITIEKGFLIFYSLVFIIVGSYGLWRFWSTVEVWAFILTLVSVLSFFSWMLPYLFSSIANFAKDGKDAKPTVGHSVTWYEESKK